jgi:hypothetical protein
MGPYGYFGNDRSVSDASGFGGAGFFIAWTAVRAVFIFITGLTGRAASGIARALASA